MASKFNRSAQKHWDDEHKLEKKIYTYRSATRRFIKTYANRKDLLNIMKLVYYRDGKLSKF